MLSWSNLNNYCIVNLTDNAIKYTPSKEKIQIEVTAHSPESSQADPGIKCVVADRGPGIPSSEQDRIFERFVRVSNDGAQMKGTGIGLSFCQTAIEAQRVVVGQFRSFLETIASKQFI